MNAPKLELVHLSPTADSRLRWADGTLKGVKMLRWVRGQVKSPHQGTVWEGARLSAESFADENEAVRAHRGIHAIWPPQLKLEGEECAALEEWERYRPSSRDEFTVLVSGWGRSVMGDVGWRAEHCRLRAIISPPRTGYLKLRAWCREHGVNWSVI